MICGMWALLLYNTHYGRKYITISYFTLSRLVDKINNYFLIQYFKSPEVKHPSQIIPPLPPTTTNTTVTAISNKSNDTTISGDHSQLTQDVLGSILEAEQPLLSKPKEKQERTFVVYENQRWWPGKGWLPKLLPGERPAWSDESGKEELLRDDIKLNNDWSWASKWSVIISPHTDIEGWEYASRFKKFEDPLKKKSFMESVRRRKWVRSAVCI